MFGGARVPGCGRPAAERAPANGPRMNPNASSCQLSRVCIRLEESSWRLAGPAGFLVSRITPTRKRNKWGSAVVGEPLAGRGRATSRLAAGGGSALGAGKWPLEGRNLPHNWDVWADGSLPTCLMRPEAGPAYASNSSVCAWGLWRSSRACQYGGIPPCTDTVIVNDQWRIVFRWNDGSALDVRLTDYHQRR
jgi:hypothetical protein